MTGAGARDGANIDETAGTMVGAVWVGRGDEVASLLTMVDCKAKGTFCFRDAPGTGSREPGGGARTRGLRGILFYWGDSDNGGSGKVVKR